jgi:polysaccharide deacetylase family protein (PEP-CTERM system associated)
LKLPSVSYLSRSISLPLTMTRHVLSFDVEEYFVVEAFRSAIKPASWSSMESRVERQVVELLELLDVSGVNATFFVLGWVAERHPSIVRAIANQGHEIASHGYGHDCVYRLSPHEFLEDVQRARKLLEDIAGTKVVGYRAPTFTVTRSTLWALDVLLEAGYRYDSSIFPIRHDRYGFAQFPTHPIRIMWENGSILDEYPMATIDTQIGRFPVAGGGYFRLFPHWTLRWAWDRLTKEHRSSVFYLHPWELDYEQPRIPVGLVKSLRHYTHLRRTKGRLIEWLGRFRWTSFRSMRESEGGPSSSLARADLPRCIRRRSFILEGAS